MSLSRSDFSGCEGFFLSCPSLIINRPYISAALVFIFIIIPLIVPLFSYVFWATRSTSVSNLISSVGDISLWFFVYIQCSEIIHETLMEHAKLNKV